MNMGMVSSSDRMHGPIPPDPPEACNDYAPDTLAPDPMSRKFCTTCLQHESKHDKDEEVTQEGIDSGEWVSDLEPNADNQGTSCCGDYHYADCPIRTGG